MASTRATFFNRKVCRSNTHTLFTLSAFSHLFPPEILMYMFYFESCLKAGAKFGLSLVFSSSSGKTSCTHLWTQLNGKELGRGRNESQWLLPNHFPQPPGVKWRYIPLIVEWSEGIFQFDSPPTLPQFPPCMVPLALAPRWTEIPSSGRGSGPF